MYHTKTTYWNSEIAKTNYWNSEIAKTNFWNSEIAKASFWNSEIAPTRFWKPGTFMSLHGRAPALTLSAMKLWKLACEKRLNTCRLDKKHSVRLLMYSVPVPVKQTPSIGADSSKALPILWTTWATHVDLGHARISSILHKKPLFLKTTSVHTTSETLWY